MSLVLDASATLAWILADEVTGATRRVLDQVAEQGAWVPALWRLEIANSLNVAIRRRRIDPAFRDLALADLRVLRIDTDPQTDERAWTDTLGLADRFGLTLYDAAYLELAQRRHLPLASLDRDLCAAARTLGIATPAAEGSQQGPVA